MKTVAPSLIKSSLFPLCLSLALLFALAPNFFGLPCPDDDSDDDSEEDCPGCTPPPVDQAMAVWRIVQPGIDLGFTDSPLGYSPTRGFPVAFGLAYRQRGVLWEGPAIFGLGTNWTTSFRS